MAIHEASRVAVLLTDEAHTRLPEAHEGLFRPLLGVSGCENICTERHYYLDCLFRLLSTLTR